MNDALGQSPEHCPERMRPASDAERTALDWAREIGEADRVIEDLGSYVRQRRRRRVAAGAACCVMLFAIGLVWQSRQVAVVPAAEHDASNIMVLRPETRMLPDGSVVELKRGAEIRVDFGGALRRIELRNGEAHFQVAKAARAFVVTARGVDVRAVGTAFSVGLGDRAVDVIVTEGQVAVAADAARTRDQGTKGPRDKMAEDAASGSVEPTARRETRRREDAETDPHFHSEGSLTPSVPPFTLTFVDAGKHLIVELASDAATVSAPQLYSLSKPEMEQRLAWRSPRLEFAGTPLAKAIPMFNEYSPVRLVLGDPALGKLQLSGVIRADNAESLLRLLEFEFGLTASREGVEILLKRLSK